MNTKTCPVDLQQITWCQNMSHKLVTEPWREKWRYGREEGAGIGGWVERAIKAHREERKQFSQLGEGKAGVRTSDIGVQVNQGQARFRHS